MDTPGPYETKATEAYYNITLPDPSWPKEKQEEYLVPVGGNLTNSSELFGQVLIGAGLGNEVNRNNTTDLYTVFSNRTGPQASGHYNAPAATLSMNWDLGPVKLTSVTGYRNSDEDQVQPFDASSLGLYIAHRIQAFHQLSQEVRAAGKATDKLDYVAGLYYYDSAYTLDQFTDLFGGGFPAWSAGSFTASRPTSPG